MKKIILVLTLFIAVNLCCWEMTMIINGTLSRAVPGIFVPVADAWMIESEVSNFLSASGTYWKTPKVGVIKFLSGTEQIGINWGGCVKTSSRTLKVQFDEKPSCEVYCRSDLKASVVEDKSAVRSLIQNFKRSNKVTFQIRGDNGHLYNVKISLKGFTKAYNEMLAKLK